MKIIKSTIEQQIKKQIEGREIAPSRDLWSEIESQSVVKTSKLSISWLPIAACFILTLCLGIVLFFNQENLPAAPSEHIVKTMTKPDIQNTVEYDAQEKYTESTAEGHKQDAAAENIPAGMESNLREQKPQVFTLQEESPAVKQNSVQILPEILPVNPEKAIAQADSAKIQVKKKRYVDPSTLLFSVEHKDVIEKTKGKSNVATIDLNGN